jgi:hypothetical protein
VIFHIKRLSVDSVTETRVACCDYHETVQVFRRVRKIVESDY